MVKEINSGYNAGTIFLRFYILCNSTSSKEFFNTTSTDQGNTPPHC